MRMPTLTTQSLPRLSPLLIPGLMLKLSGDQILPGGRKQLRRSLVTSLLMGLGSIASFLQVLKLLLAVDGSL